MLPPTPISLKNTSGQKETPIFQPVINSVPSLPVMPSKLLTLANVVELKENNLKPSGEDPDYREKLSLVITAQNVGCHFATKVALIGTTNRNSLVNWRIYAQV